MNVFFPFPSHRCWKRAFVERETVLIFNFLRGFSGKAHEKKKYAFLTKWTKVTTRLFQWWKTNFTAVVKRAYTRWSRYLRHLFSLRIYPEIRLIIGLWLPLCSCFVFSYNFDLFFLRLASPSYGLIAGSDRRCYPSRLRTPDIEAAWSTANVPRMLVLLRHHGFQTPHTCCVHCEHRMKIVIKEARKGITLVN